MPLELRAAWAVARKELLVARRYPLQLVNEVMQPLYQFLLPSLLLGATFYVGGRAIGLQASAGTDDLAGYLFLGMVVGGLVGAVFWDMAFGIKREMDSGTLEPLWLTPTRPETTVLGRAIAGLILSLLASAVLVTVGIVVFGASVAGALVAAVAALLLSAISMVGFGYAIAAAVMMMRDPNFMIDATNFTFASLSGVAFPVTVLPFFLQPISYALPTTYAVDLLRYYALGTRPLLAPGLEWAALVAFAGLSVLIGLRLFLRTEHRMRVRGTTGQH
ncbi:MAG TPA: ABC transporter permease [Candidatus Limnocylindria bacterium]|jgi:ABC-2 type transport system permease protein|nr:ABC transporter permease [Candidatus Limnocylindria bacterium]